jgi:hypothetical protein
VAAVPERWKQHEEDLPAREMLISSLRQRDYIQQLEDRVAMNVLRLRGEERADYFFVVCTECGEHVSIKLRPGVGVPVLEASCQRCRTQTEQKLMPGKWFGFVTR